MRNRPTDPLDPLFVFTIAAILGIAMAISAGLTIAIVGAVPAERSDVHAAWIGAVATLLAGGGALVAAYVALRGVRGQIDEQRRATRTFMLNATLDRLANERAPLFAAQRALNRIDDLSAKSQPPALKDRDLDEIERNVAASGGAPTEIIRELDGLFYEFRTDSWSTQSIKNFRQAEQEGINSLRGKILAALNDIDRQIDAAKLALDELR